MGARRDIRRVGLPSMVWRLVRARDLVLALLALGMVGGCMPGPTPGPTPTQEEAIAFLSQAVAFATAERWTDLCAIGGGNCERTLDDAGRGAVPPDPPTVRRTWVVPPTANTTGGRILELCGVDGQSRPYVTQMLVYRLGGEMKAIEPVYWSGMVIATEPVVPEPTPIAFCPASG